jgi:mono/diheme cytochrome c family protein
MKRRSYRLYLILMLAVPLFHLIARQVTALETEMTPGKATKDVHGGKLYRQYCQRCHDRDGSGDRGRSHADKIPDFRSAAWHGKKSDAALAVSILEGKGTVMPAFGERLNHDDAQELVAFIRALEPRSEHAGQSTTPMSRNATGDFDKRFGELKMELEELRKQYYELSRSSAQKL